MAAIFCPSTPLILGRIASDVSGMCRVVHGQDNTAGTFE
jgi:hypothetical protein